MGVAGASRDRAERALAGAQPRSFWTSQPGAPEPAAAMTGAQRADLVVVGGGFSGLWTALLARERDPSADVVLLEASTAGWAASGRNGGFCSASLTHGIGNGLSRFPDELPRLEELGAQNLAEIADTVASRGIDCDFAATGELAVATAPWQLEGLTEEAEAARALGHRVTELDSAAVRAELNSPEFLGGTWYHDTCVMVDPARLARGLRQACLDAGVRIFEHTPVRSVRTDAGALALTTPYGRIRTGQVALATGGYPPLLRRIRNYLVPVYDYVIVTRPLSAAELASLGWRNRQGAADSGNQFHYFRLTADNRILWGGYDAVYFPGGTVGGGHDQRPQTFLALAEHFFATFPQLEDVSFDYAWGGAIDTCSRFFAFYGTACRGRLAYACGHTGLGVGASRFGANVMLDLLSGQTTERTALQLVQSRPVPFPPEPARTAVIQLTRASLARADRDAGQRDLWLRVLDRLGLGFDS
ncbi:MAG TPA: FAD-dependent oxidoreductase [Streptosporangiaceae bacterium]|nr:FAD-dependent oxidoreductase [Streptosporangiaceae bacterium]